ncbi:glucose-6-phosphate isomerase [Spirochaetia bacterium]|nr:glucose-6-phosphate isomerase [Spirochaetia bacterium]
MAQIAFDWVKGFTVGFSLVDGLSKTAVSTKRKLSDMKGMFADEAAYEKVLAAGDPLVYEFYEMGAPDTASDIAFGSSITYPGKVGVEYYMTKGHFHTVLDTAEVYYAISGEGGMLLESPEGDTSFQILSPGRAVYVPPRYAHRSVCTGKTPLISFFAFRGDAGHDYGTIETKGYRKLIVEGKDGRPEIADNPKWK